MPDIPCSACTTRSPSRFRPSPAVQQLLDDFCVRARDVAGLSDSGAWGRVKCARRVCIRICVSVFADPGWVDAGSWRQRGSTKRPLTGAVQGLSGVRWLGQDIEGHALPLARGLQTMFFAYCTFNVPCTRLCLPQAARPRSTCDHA